VAPGAGAYPRVKRRADLATENFAESGELISILRRPVAEVIIHVGPTGVASASK
jgi:hypothetical protein